MNIKSEVFDPANLSLDAVRTKHRELAGPIIRTPLTLLASPAVAKRLASNQVYLKLEC